MSDSRPIVMPELPATCGAAVRLHRIVLRWRRNRLAREIRKDRRYFQPLGNGWWTTNRLMWQIKLLLAKPEKPTEMKAQNEKAQ